MLIKLEDVVDLPTEPYQPRRIQQLAVQCKAQRCYESQSRQLKNEGEKIFPRFARTIAATHLYTLPSLVAEPLKKRLPTGLCAAKYKNLTTINQNTLPQRLAHEYNVM